MLDNVTAKIKCGSNSLSCIASGNKSRNETAKSDPAAKLTIDFNNSGLYFLKNNKTTPLNEIKPTKMVAIIIGINIEIF